MISKSEFRAQASQNVQAFVSEEVKTEGGHGNLVVDGKGNAQILSEADETVVLIADGMNSVRLESDSNQLDIHGGQNTVYIAGDKNAVNADKSNNIIQAEGDKNIIDLNRGNNQVYSVGDENILLASNGDNILISEGDNNFIGVINGNNQIGSKGDLNQIRAYNGNNSISTDGDYNQVLADNGNNSVYSVGDFNTLTTGKGSDWILSKGDNNKISSGDDADAILSIGNNISIDGGEGDNEITFHGDDIAIRAGNGDNYIQSLDFAIRHQNDKSPFDYISFVDYVEKQTYLDKYTDAPVTVKKGQDVLQVENVAKDGATTSSTSTQGNQEITYSNHTTYSGVKTTFQNYENNTIVDHEDTHIVGHKNVSVSVGTGSNNMFLNVSQNLKIDGQTQQTDSDGKFVNNNPNSKNNIFVTGEIVIKDQSSRLERVFDDIDDDTVWTAHVNTQEVSRRTINTDPLIVDYDRDGKISATNGKGVDLDNDGIADGIASRGDKMLAISDMNGNGVIDGTEVFGDKTISPFTGKPLGAQNGFEALKLLALEAEIYTGVKCLDGDDVILGTLQKALQSKGFNLGFISENNITQLESLGHVASINVNAYRQVNDQTSGIQYMQRGTYKDTSGKTYQAGDFWFGA